MAKIDEYEAMAQPHSFASAIRENMSPEAVALIVAQVLTVSGQHPAFAEVAWFRKQLIEIVGGPDALSDLFDEVGF